jgi:hypothetical protein
VATPSAACALLLRETIANNNNEAAMPFLFWMPLIVMSGLLSIAEDEAATWSRRES